MLLGVVTGTVWGSQQATPMTGIKLAVVRPTGGGDEIIAADRIGACEGETVLVAVGSRVRDIVFESSTPVKAVLVGIVDGVSA